MAYIDLNPHSCKLCETLVIDHERLRILPGDPNGVQWVFEFSFTVRDLFAAAQSGCSLSQWLSVEKMWHPALSLRDEFGYDAVYASHTLEDLLHKHRMLRLEYTLCLKTSLYPSPDQNPPHTALGAPLDVGRLSLQCFALCDLASGRLICSHRWKTEGPIFLAEPGDPAAKYVTERPFPREVLSEEIIFKFKQAMEWCAGQKDHIICRRPSETFMPKRLIQVSDDEDNPVLRLCETRGIPPSDYCAMSYCWGGEQPLKSTIATLDRWMGTIPWDELPRSLQDAVTTCRKLGYRYIWIDAFCIVQDDDTDKASELIQMPSIYRNASLTIAASRSRAVADGFLHDRTRADFGQAGIFRLLHRSPDGNLGSIILVHGKDYPPEPLDTRGWCFQEGLLSRHLLSFGTRQTEWICLGMSDTFCMSNDWKRGIEQASSLRANFMIARDAQCELEKRARIHGRDPDHDPLHRVRSPLPPGMPSESEEIIKSWTNLVEVYTVRQLTLDEDKYFAIAGVAEMYGRVLRVPYDAGLWRTSLPQGLLWYNKNPELGRTKVSQPWHAPSWSWAAVKGCVSFKGWQWGLPVAEVVALNIELLDPANTYGACKTASLEIRGKIIPVCGPITSHVDEWGSARLTFLPMNGHEQLLTMTVSVDSSDAIDDHECTDVYLFCVSELDMFEWEAAGLILQKNQEGSYRRIGRFVSRALDVEPNNWVPKPWTHWFKYAIPQAIKLV